HTPEAHGVFTDDLTRARRQLASAFDSKAAGVTPIAAGTDIIGALWRVKAQTETVKAAAPGAVEIWIFSDMMNDTRSFPMPALLASGPDRMLEQTKANGLLVSLEGVKVHVLGASTRGLSPREWSAVKDFWSA